MHIFIAVVLSLASITTAAADREGPYSFETLRSPAFARLPRDRRIFAFHLMRAMQVSSDIYWHQASRHGLAIRGVMTELWRHRKSLAESERAALGAYFFKLLIEHGNYDRRTNTKFVPEHFPERSYLDLVRQVARRRRGESRRAFELEAERLRAPIFDPHQHPVLVAARPRDRIADSGVGLDHASVTEAEAKIFTDAGDLDGLSFLTRADDGRVELARPRLGGLFGSYLRAADHHLARAATVARPTERALIESLRHAFRTGLESDWTLAYRAWLINRPTDLDFMIGFVERYDDPLGVRLSWEGWVVVLDKDPATIRRTELIRAHAGTFETLMPVDENFKKPAGAAAPRAEGNDLLFASGRSGEQPFLGKNLFSQPELQRELGTKSFANVNMYPDGNEPVARDWLMPFVAPELRTLARRADLNLLRLVHTEFHEILGHGSGRLAHGVTDADLGEYYSPLEEARAETAALYHLTGPAPYQMGILPARDRDDTQTMALVQFFTSHIQNFNKQADGTERFNQAHLWARQAMMNYLIAAGCLEVSEAHVPRVGLRHVNRCHQTLGELWRNIQSIKSRGDRAAAAEFLNRFGGLAESQKQWPGLTRAQFKVQDRPLYRVFPNPSFRLTTDGRVRLHAAKRTGSPITDFITRTVTENARTKAEITRVISACDAQLDE